jgi:hypothetical protein
LAAFYTRHFAEKVPDIKPPSLQVSVIFVSDTICCNPVALYNLTTLLLFLSYEENETGDLSSHLLL